MKKENETQAQSTSNASNQAAASNDAAVAEILDKAPATLNRPLCIMGERAYLATWLSFKMADATSNEVLALLRDDGRLYTDAPVDYAIPLAEIEMDIKLPTVPAQDCIISGHGVKRYLQSGAANPAEILYRIRRLVDQFMDFSRSIGSQEDMVDLFSLFCIVTYCLDAFPSVPYLWTNGGKGSGKTQGIQLVTDISYLGTLLLSGGTYASLRDMADYGACLGFDDAETVAKSGRLNADKRALMLAGNRKGAYITVKERGEGGNWRTRYVNTFCPKLYSAINRPDDVLASRTITVPLVRSSDPSKANADPLDRACWCVDRRTLIDDLWLLGLTSMSEIQDYCRKVPERIGLSGRDLEPWRALLAVALWYQEKQGVKGIFDRLSGLATNYQQERQEIEHPSPEHVAIMGLRKLMPRMKSSIRFSPTNLADTMNDIIQDDECGAQDMNHVSPNQAGMILSRLRIKRAPRTSRGKLWRIGQAELNELERAYGIEHVDDQHGEADAGSDNVFVHEKRFPPQLTAVN